MELFCSPPPSNCFTLMFLPLCEAQPSYCGFSAMVMVLNSFELDPGRVWKAPWRWYHEDMLTCCLTEEDSFKDGITIDQFQSIAKCNGLNVSWNFRDSGHSFWPFASISFLSSNLTDSYYLAILTNRFSERERNIKVTELERGEQKSESQMQKRQADTKVESRVRCKLWK
ncbi:unnamed protein product [Rodentolepis nana]|uniref:glutathione gamma-glutamylcysteinyltransferase n=1 Tax=Rodentolepis nana TaxID=102285 RepID=A0A3P7S0L7_RODNA|nr:unnamed protein product [Rodentolepis nana]